MVVDNRGKPHGDGPTPLKLTDGTKGGKGKGGSRQQIEGTRSTTSRVVYRRINVEGREVRGLRPKDARGRERGVITLS